jgi:hypothetical protein
MIAIGKIGGAVLHDGRIVEFIAIGKTWGGFPDGHGSIGVSLPRAWTMQDMLARLIESGLEAIEDSARLGSAMVARFKI